MEERVQKIIANSGYVSRRKAEELIEKGKVRVNGRIVKLGDKADLDKDEIYLGETLIEKSKPIYIMLNKPKHYEVTMSPNVEKNVLKLIPTNERIFPVGRLDKNTTGLLLLTNDGDFANKITHPRYEKEKTYFVKLDKKITDKDIEELEKGVYLQDGKVKVKIKMYHRDQLEVTIHEGRKWILKRLFFKLGYYINELSRTRIGKLKLDVKLGKWRFLTKKEVDELMR
ncbi:MAG TPA: pseudouridine synthase [Alphaproteobacteria bacterium]|nr:pseudouridine synthase [Alphaproteobacteria bacterium]